MEIPRLDIMLYAHDGRGLGHASRTVAIGMALRRLYPELRVLFVSGCKVSQELIGRAPLDWLKLPSYETAVVGGKSRGIAGNSGYGDRELGELRGAQLAQLVQLYRPRVVLADHTPQGKHRELLPALTAARDLGSWWVLGVRGVVGAVPQAASGLARQVFDDHYHHLLWYGDPVVLGSEHRQGLEAQYGVEPVACGYVARLREVHRWQKAAGAGGMELAGTISIPWLGEHCRPFLTSLAEALRLLGPDCGSWRMFLGRNTFDDGWRAEAMFDDLPHCRVEPLSGAGYVESLGRSKMALIYGGYNSLMDVLALGLPAVVVLRAMQDREQQQHLERLQHAAGELLSPVEEHAAGAESLCELMRRALGATTRRTHRIDMDGAATAAKLLAGLLNG
jgi:predicted glycosyltransferase